MSTTLYTKEGRRYRAVREYDPLVMDSFPKGAHLVVVTPGIRSTRCDVNPAHASVLAAAHRMREPMIEALRTASKIHLDRNRKLNVAQKQAYDALATALGEAGFLLHYKSLTDVVDAGLKVLEEAAVQSQSDFLSPEQWLRLRDWMADPKRAPANTAFTAGAARDAATAHESAEALRAGWVAGSPSRDVQAAWLQVERADGKVETILGVYGTDRTWHEAADWRADPARAGRQVTELILRWKPYVVPEASVKGGAA